MAYFPESEMMMMMMMMMTTTTITLPIISNFILFCVQQCSYWREKYAGLSSHHCSLIYTFQLSSPS
jgi:hypothetical protein